MHPEFKKYFREKRIRRIQSFYHQFQTSNDDDRAYERISLISRDAKVQFILTLFGLMIFGWMIRLLHLPSLVSSVVAGFLAVEAADYIMIRGVKFFDRLFDYIIPVTVFILFIGFITFHESLKDRFISFRDRYNDELQSKPKKNVSDVGAGDNWEILGFEKGDSHPMTLPKANQLCSGKGTDWSLYDGESQLIPPLVLKTSQYFWVKNMPGQVNAGEFRKPGAWFAPKPNTKVLALCVRKK